MLEEFYKRDPNRDIDQIFAALVPGAPAVKQAEAKLESAERDLDQAEVNLRYCEIIAEIDGVVTRRNVNPGNNVLAGQGLMAIRSLDEIWVDANFKETQLQDLRIGQPADLYVDMYGGRRVFPGRIAGFTALLTLALLPPQNATGNFVKVVQRLPVRIESVNTTQTMILCSSASVVPGAHLNRPATGPDAGKILKPVLQSPAAALLRSRWAATNDAGGDCAAEPSAHTGSLPPCGADLYGGVDTTIAAGRAALSRPSATVNDGEGLSRVTCRQRYYPADHRLLINCFAAATTSSRRLLYLL
jgi:hypothetical protein